MIQFNFVSFKEHILFFAAALLLSYFIINSTLDKKSNEYYLYFIIITLVLYFFFIFVLSDTYSKKNKIENYTNGIDDFNEQFSTSEESTSEEEDILPSTVPSSVYYSSLSEEEEETSTGTSTGTTTGTSTSGKTGGDSRSGSGSGSGSGKDNSQKQQKQKEQPSSEDEEKSSTKPDTSGFIFNKPTTGNAYGPLNINVSYKVDECDKDGKNGKKKCDPVNPYTDDLSDMGKYNYKSRVHNNTQWWDSDQYGKQAWTNQPDMFIPPDSSKKQPVQNRPQFQNEINYKHNSSDNKQEPCPIEINDPWSPYMSGDYNSKEPQPFNL